MSENKAIIVGCSPQLNELAAALAKAQGEVQPAPKDASNPYYKSKYSSLPAVREAMQDAFAKHGLAVLQIPFVEDGQLQLRTMLLHESGQWADCGTLKADVDLSNPQHMGSATTYFRRYALAAISQTVADTDDDANAVAQSQQRRKAATKATTPKPLTGHDVVALQQEIQDAPTVESLVEILKSDKYLRLKGDTQNADIYEQTASLAKAKKAMLTTPEAE